MNQGSTRRCVRCGLAAGYNREVVDVVTDCVVGSLCRNCECETLANATQGGDDETCAMCDRDPFYALPRWLPETTTEAGVVVCDVDYERDEDAIHLCDEHYHDVVAETSPATTHEAPSARDHR